MSIVIAIDADRCKCSSHYLRKVPSELDRVIYRAALRGAIILCVLLLAAFGAVPYGFGMRRVALIIAEPLRP